VLVSVFMRYLVAKVSDVSKLKVSIRLGKMIWRQLVIFAIITRYWLVTFCGR
jgi:hypothetical protein